MKTLDFVGTEEVAYERTDWPLPKLQEYQPMYIILLAVNRYESTQIVVNLPESIYIGNKPMRAQSLLVDYGRSRSPGIDWSQL